jgi:3-oxoacyl-[acyl-carrier protein] reductase
MTTGPGPLAITDKVVLVTGGTRGIGLSIAQAYLARSARVMITGQSEAGLAAAAAHLGDSTRYSGVAVDLAKRGAPEQCVHAALEKFGRLDVLVNNAAVTGPTDPWGIDLEEWDQVHSVNLRASFFCAREAARAMEEGKRGGSIINISSVAGQIGGAATGPAYVSSKAGLIGLTRSLARHFARFGVRVNCIAPADIETAMTAAWPKALRERLISATPLARFGRTEEVAAAAVFLGSDAASYITGQTININGGLYMG